MATLASRDVHTWCVSLDVPPDTSAVLYATLSQDERNRSARLRFERDRQRFIVAHGVLRDLLGRYLNAHPGQLRFVCNAFGKPELGSEFGSRLKFNLSHSADRALIAMAADAEVGIDLEYIQEDSDFAEIARFLFSAADADRLNRLPSHLQAEAFFRYWTKREAYVKARGESLGLYGASDAIAPTRSWSLHTLRPAPGYIGALAIQGRGWRLSQRHWS